MTFSFTPDAKLINVKIPTWSRAKYVKKIQAVFKETSSVFNTYAENARMDIKLWLINNRI
jgi:hypothetical protein